VRDARVGHHELAEEEEAEDPGDDPREPQSRVTHPERDATTLRQEAQRACDEQRWDECEAKLEAARELEAQKQ
jgi:hypothetical protein